MSHHEPLIVLRPLTLDDHAALVALQLRCFPKMQPWRLAQFASQVRTFPAGQVGLFVDGELVGSSACLVVDYAEYEAWHDWKVVADDGFIRNHDPEGDTLYGIELQVDADHRGRKYARRLYDRRKELCRELNLERMVIGGRIPGYARHADQLTAQAYVDAVEERRIADPVLSAQLAAGFTVRDVVADYLPSDEDSAGYATILEWVNLDYVPTSRGRHRRAVSPVRVGIVQYPMRRVQSFEDFATQVEYFVDTASDYRCDFLLFPELFSLQLLSILEPGPAPKQARELAGFADRYRAMFRDLALRYDINLIGGSTFVLEGNDLYNVAMLFRRDGTTGEQKKLHVTPSEAKWWGIRGGDSLEVFDTDRGKIAMLICYDVEFPELTRVLAARGARMLFVPFNTNDRQGFLRVRQCAHARCIENHMYTAISGCVGHLPQVQNADLHYAASAILTPCDVAFPADGIAAQCAPAIEELLVQDLDLEHLRRHKATGTVRNWDDRRVDLYRVQFGDEVV